MAVNPSRKHVDADTEGDGVGVDEAVLKEFGELGEGMDVDAGEDVVIQ
jgi:hypothetical protein